MNDDRQAGPCVNGQRHRWRSGTRALQGALLSVYHEACQRCRRIRIREYTRRGNHIRGYFTTQVEGKEAP